MFKNFAKNVALGACLASMLMINDGWGMTTGKHIKIEWTEEEQQCISNCMQLIQDLEEGNYKKEANAQSYSEYMEEHFLKPLPKEAPLIARLKFSKLKQLQSCLDCIIKECRQ